eukprot:TRINITY_DN9249_c0_g1_i1.p1 TRINITY_DN9249_c0_g1~~TRINITY_DN9249_c0_g1_i1.p1  ORF type:complete len:494 (-),score=117.59 TRINITY_DN9249_c0_g1_i1:26-1507(-)
MATRKTTPAVELLPYKEFTRGIGKFRNSEEFSDVKIVVEDEGKIKRYYAHRLILTAGSEFFRAMLSGSFVEAGMKEITLKELSFDAFELLLDYLYTASVDIPEGSELAVLALAQRFQSPGLLLAAEQQLVASMTPGRVCALLRSCAEYEAHSTADSCLDYIARNFRKISRTSDISQLTADEMLKLVQSERIGCEEIDVFTAIVNWGKLNKGDKTLQEVCGEMAQYVRVGLIEAEALRHKVAPTGLVAVDRLVEALLAVALGAADEDEKKLPFWLTPRGMGSELQDAGVQHFDPKHCNSQITIGKNKRTAKGTAGYSWYSVSCTGRLSTGIHYLEVQPDFANSDILMLGVVHEKERPTSTSAGGSFSASRGYMFQMVNKHCYHNHNEDSQPDAAGKAKLNAASLTITKNDRIGCVLNLVKKTIEFKYNGKSLGIAYKKIAPGPYHFACDFYGQAGVTLRRYACGDEDVEEATQAASKGKAKGQDSGDESGEAED